jgi:hypothetical protein
MSITMVEDMLKSKEYLAQFFSNASNIPISFVLDGRIIHGIPEEWHPVMKQHIIDANISETIFEGSDSITGLNIGE